MMGFKSFFMSNNIETILLLRRVDETPVVTLNSLTHAFPFYNPYKVLKDFAPVKFLWYVGRDPPNPNKEGMKCYVGT